MLPIFNRSKFSLGRQHSDTALMLLRTSQQNLQLKFSNFRICWNPYLRSKSNEQIQTVSRYMSKCLTMSLCFMISMAMKIMKQRRSKWRPPLSSLQLLLPARKHHAVWNHTIKQRKTLKRHNYRHYWSCLVKRFQYWLSILSLLRGVGSLQLDIQRPVDMGTSAAETLFLAYISLASQPNTFPDSWCLLVIHFLSLKKCSRIGFESHRLSSALSSVSLFCHLAWKILSAKASKKHPCHAFVFCVLCVCFSFFFFVFA